MKCVNVILQSFAEQLYVHTTELKRSHIIVHGHND